MNIGKDSSNIEGKKALILLSGGIDSTTCLALAIDQFGVDNVMGLCITYGQKHSKEVKCAENIAKYYGVALYKTDVSPLYVYSECTLLKGRGEMEHKEYAEQLKDLGGEGTVATYVPFRNGLFLSAAAAVGLSLEANYIYYGAHADDAAGRAYPDCTPEFEKSMGDAIYEGSGKSLEMVAPLLNLSKTEVVKLGLGLKAPYHLTWSCYEGRRKQCGTCGTCLDRRKAFENNNATDPVEYEV